MAKYVDWKMEGVEFGNCNCSWGCPCQFNGLPTNGNCRAFCFVQIEKGHFGDVRLDGLRWGILGAWPSAIHLGNGTFISVRNGPIRNSVSPSKLCHTARKPSRVR